jgi:hypothetical protein
MILYTVEYFNHHVNILTGNNIDFVPVSGRSDLPQSQPISGTLDPGVKDVIINFQAYCCVLQDCFPVHPPSRKPIPRKRPAAYKYTDFLQWILVHKIHLHSHFSKFIIHFSEKKNRDSSYNLYVKLANSLMIEES